MRESSFLLSLFSSSFLLFMGSNWMVLVFFLFFFQDTLVTNSTISLVSKFANLVVFFLA